MATGGHTYMQDLTNEQMKSYRVEYTLTQCWVKGFRETFAVSGECMPSSFCEEHIPEKTTSTQLYQNRRKEKGRHEKLFRKDI